MKKHVCIVVASIASAFINGCDGEQDTLVTMDRIAGEWIDARSGDWIYGFYDDYAVADNDFWNYESVEVTDREVRLVLRREGDSPKGKKRKVVLRLDSACDSVVIDRTRFWHRTGLLRTDSYVAAARSGRLRLNAGLSYDSVTVKGRIAGAVAGRTVTVQFHSLLQDEEAGRTFEALTDSEGRFSLRMPCVGVSSLSVDCREERLSEYLTVSPAETVMMSYGGDDNSRKLRVMSRYARMDREYDDFMRWKGKNRDFYWPDYRTGGSHEEYMIVCERVYDYNVDMLKRYIASHSSVSEAFVAYARMMILDDYVGAIAQRRYSIGRNKALPDGFVGRADSLMSLQRSPYTLLSPSSMDNYLSLMPTKSWASADIETLRYLDRKGVLTLEEGERKALDICDEAVGAVLASDDSVRSGDDEKILAEAEKVKKRLWQSDTVNDFIEENGRDIIRDIVDLQLMVLSNAAAIDCAEMCDSLREICVARLFLTCMMHEQHSLGKVFLEAMDDMLHDDVLKNLILSENEKFMEMEQRAVDYPESLKSNDDYVGITNTETLWRAVTAPYAGKVLALDFWGTWCGPCKQELPAMAELMRDYEERDVVFIYFATHSPEESWMNVLKQEGLTAPNIVHFNLPPEQTDLLVHKFGVKAYPTHILVDRNGNPLPEPVNGLLFGGDDLRQAIDRLVSE